MHRRVLLDTRYEWERFFFSCTEYTAHIIPQCDFGKRTPRGEREEKSERVTVLHSQLHLYIWASMKKYCYCTIVLHIFTTTSTYFFVKKKLEKKRKIYTRASAKSGKTAAMEGGGWVRLCCVFFIFFLGSRMTKVAILSPASYALFDYIHNFSYSVASKL